MTRPRMFPKALAVTFNRRKFCVSPVAAVLTVVLLSAAIAAAGIAELFAVFQDDSGTGLTATADSTLNGTNPFFDPSIGTNGQACVTCHEPDTGITITVPFINSRFTATGGTDPLFRPNDTANNPSLLLSSHTADDYSVFLALGTARIGEQVQQAATPNDFTVVAANDATNAKFAAPDMFPLITDPQHPGVATLFIFRRTLVNVNVNFDSSVLWDGRANISNMPAQVNGAIKTLLLGAGGDATVNNAIVNFMTGVYTAQKSDNAAGQLDALGATGGVDNLIALSQSASRPCVFDRDSPTPDITPFVEAVATSSSCTPVVPGSFNFSPGGMGTPANGGHTFTLFEAWENLSPNNAINMARLSIARGEKIFNTRTAVGGHCSSCTGCHSVPNVGNNPSANFMIREGHDSPTILAGLKAAALASGDANATEEAQQIQDMIDRASLLPFYCLRPTSDTSGTPCGADAVDKLTTDPARALVTGHIANTGAQKPPILRNLAVRPPFFHNGDAVDMQHLVTFYKFFLNMSLSQQDAQDLVNFLNAL